MKIKSALLLLTALLTLSAFAENIPLKEVTRPSSIEVDEKNLYVIERSEILIYSLNDLRLKKRFGKSGEGPGEFMGAIEVSLTQNRIFIYSMGKISFYSKDGKLQEEKRIKGGLSTAGLKPFGGGFVGYNIHLEDGIIYRILCLYNGETEKIKDLDRVKYPMQRSGDLPVLETAFNYSVLDHKLFYAIKKEFEVNVLQPGGKKLFSIHRKTYKRRPFTEGDEKQVRDFFKSQLRERYERIKNRFTFPRTFPAIWFLLPADNQLFIFTWEKNGENVEVFLYNKLGQFKRQLKVPVLMQDQLNPYPLTISGERFYQLVENEKNETWELLVTGIK